jgi:hypothetical protein
MTMKTKLITFVSIICLVGSNLAISDILLTRTRLNSFGFIGTAGSAIPLTNSPTSTSVNFVTTKSNQRLVFTYNAECSVTSVLGVNNVYLNTDIVIDNGANRIIASPTISDNAMCTSDNDPGGNWVSATVMGVATIPTPGVHNVTVAGFITGGGEEDTAAIDDATFMIQE